MSDVKPPAPNSFERELEAFLHDDDSPLAVLYRKLPHAEPDRALDARIRTQAQQALREPPPRKAWPARWLPAAGLAASLVLAAGIAWRVGPQVWPARNDISPETATSNGMTAPKRQADMSSPATAPGAAPASPGGPTDAASAKSAERATTPAPLPQAEQKARDAMPPAPSPARAVVPADLPKAFPAQTEPRRQTLAAPAPTTAAAAATAAQLKQRSASVPALKSEPQAQTIAPNPAAASFPPPPPPPPPMAPAAPLAKPANAPEAAMAEPVAADQSGNDGAAAGSLHELYDSTSPLSAKQWIAHIRDLQQRHQHDEAVRALHEFRNRYPDYPIPDDLRDLK